MNYENAENEEGCMQCKKKHFLLVITKGKCRVATLRLEEESESELMFIRHENLLRQGIYFGRKAYLGSHFRRQAMLHYLQSNTYSKNTGTLESLWM